MACGARHSVTLTDDEIWTCRAAIKRIAWLKTKDERQTELSKYAEPLRGVIERGVLQIFPIVKEKRKAGGSRRKSEGREAGKNSNNA